MSPTAKSAIGKTRVLGSITVIDTPLVTSAMEFARTHSEPYLFNHAVRSWLFAARLGQLQGITHDAEVVAVSALLHDIGLTNSFTGQRRFEIEGADAARAFAQEQGLDDRRVQLIWDTVALEFHAFDRPAQGNGSRALHVWYRSRLWWASVRSDPARRDEWHSQRISSTRHEAVLHRIGVRHR